MTTETAPQVTRNTLRGAIVATATALLMLGGALGTASAALPPPGVDDPQPMPRPSPAPMPEPVTVPLPMPPKPIVEPPSSDPQHLVDTVGAHTKQNPPVEP